MTTTATTSATTAAALGTSAVNARGEIALFLEPHPSRPIAYVAKRDGVVVLFEDRSAERLTLGRHALRSLLRAHLSMVTAFEIDDNGTPIRHTVLRRAGE